MRHPKEKLNYDYIADGIYIGTNQCCQTHFDEQLLKKGITAEISMEHGRIDMPFGVEVYSWLPVKDHYAPTQGQLKVGVAILQKLTELKKKVYVHCKNGHGRAPTLVAAYFISQGVPLKDALALLKRKRPIVHLNQRQIRSLKKFKKA
jgi:hypothetical protein